MDRCTNCLPRGTGKNTSFLCFLGQYWNEIKDKNDRVLIEPLGMPSRTQDLEMMKTILNRFSRRVSPTRKVWKDEPK